MTEKHRIVCPHCDATNSVPADKPAQIAKCGRCHKPLFDGHPVALDGARFARHLASSDLPLIVDFWASWCGPCRAMAPIFDRAAQALQPRARFIKIDVDANSDLAAQYGVRGIPALFAFKHGKVVEQHSGMADERMLAGWVERLGAEV